MTEALPIPLPADDEKAKISASTSSDTPSPAANDVYIDPAIEKRVIRKCDLRVIPPTLILFMLSFLDRVNIGNAAIQGLPEDLALVGHQFNVALLILFIPFILLEIPSNLVMKKLNPSTWLSVLLFGCGKIVSTRERYITTDARDRNHEHVYGLRPFIWGVSWCALPPWYIRGWTWTRFHISYLNVLPTLRVTLETVVVVLLWNHRGLLWRSLGLCNCTHGWNSRV